MVFILSESLQLGGSGVAEIYTSFPSNVVAAMRRPSFSALYIRNSKSELAGRNKSSSWTIPLLARPLPGCFYGLWLITTLMRSIWQTSTFIGRNSSTHPAQRYKIGVNMLSNRNPQMNNHPSGLPRIYFFAQHLSQREEKWKIGL